MGTGLGAKFGRKPAKNQIHIIILILYSKRRSLYGGGIIRPMGFIACMAAVSIGTREANGLRLGTADRLGVIATTSDDRTLTVLTFAYNR